MVFLPFSFTIRLSWEVLFILKGSYHPCVQMAQLPSLLPQHFSGLQTHVSTCQIYSSDLADISKSTQTASKPASKLIPTDTPSGQWEHHLLSQQSQTLGPSEMPPLLHPLQLDPGELTCQIDFRCSFFSIIHTSVILVYTLRISPLVTSMVLCLVTESPFSTTHTFQFFGSEGTWPLLPSGGVLHLPITPCYIQSTLDSLTLLSSLSLVSIFLLFPPPKTSFSFLFTCLLLSLSHVQRTPHPRKPSLCPPGWVKCLS